MQLVTGGTAVPQRVIGGGPAQSSGAASVSFSDFGTTSASTGAHHVSRVPPSETVRNF